MRIRCIVFSPGLLPVLLIKYFFFFLSSSFSLTWDKRTAGISIFANPFIPAYSIWLEAKGSRVNSCGEYYKFPTNETVINVKIIRALALDFSLRMNNTGFCWTEDTAYVINHVINRNLLYYTLWSKACELVQAGKSTALRHIH